MFTGEPLFPGDSDVDQLWLILKCMGQLPPAYAGMLSRNEYFAVSPLTRSTEHTDAYILLPSGASALVSVKMSPLVTISLCTRSHAGHEAARVMGAGAAGEALSPF